MRIISGERRGHKLEGPNRKAKPTSDLVRESIFNILSDTVSDRPVVDLFAGTGALGLEALSRGASQAIFVERDRGNAEVIRRNISHLRYEDRSTVLMSDAYKWAKTGEISSAVPMVVFVDPPYRDYENQAKRLSGVIANLMARLPQESMVVVEGPEHGAAECLNEGVEWDVRYYGGTMIAVGQVPGPAASEEARATEPGPAVSEDVLPAEPLDSNLT